MGVMEMRGTELGGGGVEKMRGEELGGWVEDEGRRGQEAKGQGGGIINATPFATSWDPHERKGKRSYKIAGDSL